MAHAVSLTYTRFDHMSPAAMALAALLHAAVGAALFWVSPLNHIDSGPDAIEITMEREPTPAETPQPPQPSPTPEPLPPQAAARPAPPPSPPPVPPSRLGLAPVGPSTDPKATPGAEKPEPPKPDTATEAARPEPPKPEDKAEAARPEPAKPEQQQALAAPPPPPAPPPPSLEKALPQLEAPPPPVTSREVPRPAPPPPAPKAPPPQAAQRPQPQPAPRPPPPAPQQQLQASPLSRVPQQRAPGDQQASRQSPTFVNPADMLGQKRAEEQYLWYVARKISQHQQFVRNVNTESGTVVVRLIIARDGRLVDVGLTRSSGLPSLDNATLNLIRSAGPYPPLPNDISGAQHTFVLPLAFRRNE